MAPKIREILALLWEKLQGWVEQAALLFPNFVVAALVLVAFWILARIARRSSLALFKRLIRSVEVAWLASLLLYVVTLGAGVVVALGVLGLDKTVTSLLAGAGIAGLALALAFQDLGQNILAGIYLSLRDTVNAGNVVATNGHFGTIRAINLRATHLTNPQGQLVVIPNREVFQNVLVNYSTGERRVDLAVGVSYGDDLDLVKRVTREAVEGVPDRDAARAVEVFFTEFADSAVLLEVRFWIPFKRHREFLEARSEAILRIKRAYREHGITIPFPIRTLDFGIVGGEKLSAMLAPSDDRDGGGSPKGTDAPGA